jgi:hypothetical protein
MNSGGRVLGAGLILGRLLDFDVLVVGGSSVASSAASGWGSSSNSTSLGC